MALEKLRSREIIGASQDGYREWVSLLAAIYAIAMKIPPTLNYHLELGRYLRDIEVKDVDDKTI